jgi:hypothetical protein
MIDENDFSKYIRMKNGVAERIPIPQEIYGFPRHILADLDWIDPNLGFTGLAWWPEDDVSPPLGRFEAYGTEETLTPDFDNKVVKVVRNIIKLVNLSRRISPAGFYDRFTSDEKTAVEMAALDDPQGTEDARETSAMVRAFLRHLSLVRYVDLDSIATASGMQFLESLGIVTTERVQAILTAEVTVEEEA